MRCLALTDLPNGIPAGREFECHPDEFAVLEHVGAARKADEPQAAVKRPVPPPKAKTYSRRDMTAAATSTLEPPVPSKASDPAEE